MQRKCPDTLSSHLGILDADNRVAFVVVYSGVVHGRASFLLYLCRAHTIIAATKLCLSC